MLELLTDPTVITVSLGALMLGLTSGALGTFAVLRRQSLLGDTREILSTLPVKTPERSPA